jgi:hypothetical protein
LKKLPHSPADSASGGYARLAGLLVVSRTPIKGHDEPLNSSESAGLQGTVTPVTLRWASIVLGAYALLVTVNATVLQAMNNWAGIAQYPRALIRSAGVALVVWGLIRRAVWAWWLAVVLGVFWLATGVFGLVAILSVLTPDADAGLPPGFFVTGSITVVLLAAAVILLCVPSSRAAFRRKAG